MTIKYQAVTFLVFIYLSACSVQKTLSVPVMHDLGQLNNRKERIAITVDAPVWLWDSRIRYRLLYKDPTAIAYYNLDRWEAPIPTLLEQQLNIPKLTKPFSLKIQLTQFEQRFSAPDKAHVLMELRISAFSNKENKLFAEQVFRGLEKTTSPDAQGAILGFSQLTKQMNTQIVVWLQSF